MFAFVFFLNSAFKFLYFGFRFFLKIWSFLFYFQQRIRFKYTVKPGYKRGSPPRPKLEPVLPKQNRPNPDIRDLLSSPDNSLISGLHCIYF